MAGKLRRTQSALGLPVAVAGDLVAYRVGMHWPQRVVSQRVQGWAELLHPLRRDRRTLDRRRQSPAEKPGGQQRLLVDRLQRSDLGLSGCVGRQ